MKHNFWEMEDLTTLSMRDAMNRLTSPVVLCACVLALQACGGGQRDADVAATATPSVASSSAASSAVAAASGAQSVASSFELVGGWRLQVEFASEGLALVSDADGFVVEAIGGAQISTAKVNAYDLRGGAGKGSMASAYPVLAPTRQWSMAALFPKVPAGQNLRDYAVRRTASGYELAAIGRVYYNTSPRPATQINVRELLSGGTVLGAAREVAVDLPEQEFSGFVKHADGAADFTEIGAGAYDSGQGSVGGLSYAVQQPGGAWKRVLAPPSFGDLAAPRLPRDADYSCTDASSWVCIVPANGKGVWSTERIGGGGVMYGDNLLFLPTLGYGPRNYAKQTYTFGDPALDQAVAYFFKRDAASGTVVFAGYDRWIHAAPGELVLGSALGRLRGSDELLLFVVKSYAWPAGRYVDGSVLQVFRVKSG